MLRRLRARISRAPRDVEGRVGGAVDRLYAWLEANRVTRTPWAVIQVVSKSEGALLAGSMAYYTFLSLMPMLMVAAFVISRVAELNVDVHDAVVKAIQGLVPTADGARLLRQLVGSGVGFGLVALVTLAYAGSGFVGALTASLNRMWEIAAGRNPVVQKVVNVTVAAALGAVLVGSVGASLWVGYVAKAAFGTEAGPVLTAIDWLAAPLSLFGLLVLIYRLLPARPLSWRSQLPGAAAAALGIEVLKRAFALWAEHSAGVSAIPRSLVTVVLLLVWFGFVSQVILYGAAINVVRESRRSTARRPTLAG